MKRAFATSTVFLIALLSFAACRSGGGDLSKADTQRRFGVRMARMNLWREAMFRFRRATEIEPENAMARNNLAVALEATGDFDGAAREYREALRLDRSNEHIQKNYSRFVEFTQKAKKRAPVTTAAATATAATPPAEAAGAPPTTGPSQAPPPAPEPPAVTTTTTTTNPPEDGV